MAWYNGILNRIYQAMPQKVRVMVKYAPAGVNVSHDIVLKHTAVWSSVKIITETLGCLSVKVYKPKENGGKALISEGPEVEILSRKPNPEMTAKSFYEALTAHLMLWGNGYAEIERNMLGQPVALWPITPDRVTPKRIEGLGLIYEINVNQATPARFEPKDILHVHGFGWDGTVGYDVFSYMSDAFGRAMATDEHAGAFFKNGAQPSGALCAPKETKLSQIDIDNIKTSFRESHGSVKNFFKEVILTGGVEWKNFSLSPEQSQLLETRKFTVSDIARIFRIPPHMLADLEKATFSNIEQQSTDFAVFTMLPVVTTWETEINTKVLKKGQFVKFNLNSLMRGDTQARYSAYQIGRQWGWLNANDIRQLEDMDPIDGIAGSAYLVPLNYQLADDLDKEPVEPAPAPGTKQPGEGDPQKKEPITNFLPLIDDLKERATNRLFNAITAKSEKRGPYWPEEAEAIFNKFETWFLQAVTPIQNSGYKINEPAITACLGKIKDKIINDQQPTRADYHALISEALNHA